MMVRLETMHQAEQWWDIIHAGKNGQKYWKDMKIGERQKVILAYLKVVTGWGGETPSDIPNDIKKQKAYWEKIAHKQEMNPPQPLPEVVKGSSRTGLPKGFTPGENVEDSKNNYDGILQFCIECGDTLVPNTKFCGKCGTKITS